MTDPEANLLIDVLKHRATRTLSAQYRTGHNGTAGDLDLMDEMVRTRNLRHVDDFKNCFIVFFGKHCGDSFCVPDGQTVNEVLSGTGMESALEQRYIIPASLGSLVLQRQCDMLQILNIMVENVLDQGSETRDRSQLVKNPKPATTPLSDSMSNQTTVKLNSQELLAIASDQKSSIQEYLSLLHTQSSVLCVGVNAEFFSRPELVCDEKGRSLPVHTDKYVGQLCLSKLYNLITDL